VLDSKVDFLIVGAQKCGTTALAHYLRQHPDIYMAGTPGDGQRSLHYFDREQHFQSDQPDYAEYHRQFHLHSSEPVVGECTPAYIYWTPAVTRIWQYNPRIKLVSILRNPVARAFSNWNMERQRGNESLDFHPACLKERDRAIAALPLQNLVSAYTARSLYTPQVRRLQQHFHDQQLLFIKYEQFRAEPLETVNRICSFLDVAPLQDIEPEQVHKRSYDRKISDQEKAYLQQLFEPDIEALEQLLGWDCTDWRT
jgi:sulfotransferase family protein